MAELKSFIWDPRPCIVGVTKYKAMCHGIFQSSKFYYEPEVNDWVARDCPMAVIENEDGYVFEVALEEIIFGDSSRHFEKYDWSWTGEKQNGKDS